VRDIGGITDENRGLAAGTVAGVVAGVVDAVAVAGRRRSSSTDGPAVNTAGGGTAGHPANPANPVDIVDGVDVVGTGRVDNFI